MQPLHESAERKATDRGSDALILALARAYALSQSYPTRHGAVQGAIADVRALAREPVHLIITPRGVECGGGSVMDRHGFLRELWRDLRAAAVSELTWPPELTHESIVSFLEALKLCQSSVAPTLEDRLHASEHPGPTALMVRDANLDPVDLRLDEEALVPDEHWSTTWEGMEPAPALDGPLDEIEWQHQAPLALPESEKWGATGDAFAEPSPGLAPLAEVDDEQASLLESLGDVEPSENPDPFVEAVDEEAPAEEASPWDESATPMPWEDVGGYWGEPADWGGGSEDAFWSREKADTGASEIPASDPADASFTAASGDGEPPRPELEQEHWQLEEMGEPTGEFPDGTVPIADLGLVSGPSDHLLTPGAELARLAGGLIQSDQDLAQVHAFRAALSDATDPPFDAAVDLEQGQSRTVVPVATLAPDQVPVQDEPTGAYDAYEPTFTAQEDEHQEDPVLADQVSFAEDATFAQVACAALSEPLVHSAAALEDVLARGAALRSQGEYAAIVDAIEEVFASRQRDYDGSNALAHQLADASVVAVLVERLGEAKQPEERTRALDTSVRLASLVAPALVQALSDVPPRPARRNFLDALFRMGDTAFTQALPMLEDSRWFIVRNAVDIIGETDCPGAIERLAVTLSHPDARVRKATVMAMAKIGGSEAGMRLLSAFEDPDGDVREAAALAVGHLRVARAVRPLLELLDKERDDELQIIVLVALGQIGDPVAVPAIEKRALGTFFSRPATNVRIAAYRALAGMGTPHATQLIRQAVHDKTPDVAAVAASLSAALDRR